MRCACALHPPHRYLTEEFGVSDIRAGTLYGLWGTLLTLYGFALGGMIDVLGVFGQWSGCWQVPLV